MNKRVDRALSAFSRYRRSRGFGIHSPFAYRFVTGVLREKAAYYAYDRIAAARQAAVDGGAEGVLPLGSLQLLFRVVNYFNPSAVLQIGSDGVVASCSLAVSSHLQLVVCDSRIDGTHLLERQTDGFSDERLTTVATFSEALSAIGAVKSPFVAVNSLDSVDADALTSFLYGCESGIVVFLRLDKEERQQQMWHLLNDDDDEDATGMGFSNGKVGVLVLSPKLPHHDYPLWL